MSNWFQLHYKKPLLRRLHHNNDNYYAYSAKSFYVNALQPFCHRGIPDTLLRLSRNILMGFWHNFAAIISGIEQHLQ